MHFKKPIHVITAVRTLELLGVFFLLWWGTSLTKNSQGHRDKASTIHLWMSSEWSKPSEIICWITNGRDSNTHNANWWFWWYPEIKRSKGTRWCQTAQCEITKGANWWSEESLLSIDLCLMLWWRFLAWRLAVFAKKARAHAQREWVSTGARRVWGFQRWIYMWGNRKTQWAKNIVPPGASAE